MNGTDQVIKDVIMKIELTSEEISLTGSMARIATDSQKEYKGRACQHCTEKVGHTGETGVMTVLKTVPDYQHTILFSCNGLHHLEDLPKDIEFVNSNDDEDVQYVTILRSAILVDERQEGQQAGGEHFTCVTKLKHAWLRYDGLDSRQRLKLYSLSDPVGATIVSVKESKGAPPVVTRRKVDSAIYEWVNHKIESTVFGDVHEENPESIDDLFLLEGGETCSYSH